MKSTLIVSALFSILFGGQAFACNCVNISGNPSMDDYCQDLGMDGICDDAPNVCLGVASCVNVSGNSSMDQYCQELGEDGICDDNTNICEEIACSDNSKGGIQALLKRH